MGMFKNLAVADDVELNGDTLGSNFDPKPTGVYDAKITMAYAGKSPKGAQCVTVHADIRGGEIRETIYITNTKGETFYLSKDGKNTKHVLPGFTTIDDLCLLATEAPLSEQVTEEKTVKLYDYEAKKEIPKAVTAFLANLIN